MYQVGTDPNEVPLNSFVIDDKSYFILLFSNFEGFNPLVSESNVSIILNPSLSFNKGFRNKNLVGHPDLSTETPSLLVSNDLLHIYLVM
jgi:intein-encoded DNA endonuclease-like protein